MLAEAEQTNGEAAAASAARAAIAAVTRLCAADVKPPCALTSAIWSAVELTAEVEALERIHSDLDARTVGLTPDVVPIPPELVVDAAPTTIVRAVMRFQRADGSETESETELTDGRRTLTSRAEILAYHAGDKAAAAPRLKALRRYELALRAGPNSRLLAKERAAHELWIEARDRQAERLNAMLQVPVHSAAAAATKLEVYSSMMGGGHGLECEEDLAAAFSAAERDLAVLAGRRVTDEPARAVAKAWTTALADYQRATAARDAAVAADRAQVLAVNLQGPASLRAPGLVQDQAPIWTGVGLLDCDVLLTPADRARLRPLLEEWLPERSRLLQEAAASGLSDTAFGDLHDAADQATSALLATEAPGRVEALLQQRVYAARLAEDDNDQCSGFDDLGWCAWKSDDRWRGRPLVQMFCNAVRSAGLDHPALHAVPFSPRQWVESFELAGGMVSRAHQGLLLIPDAIDADVFARLRAELDIAPHRYWAVNLYAEERRGWGGDPIHDCAGNFGTNDHRGGQPKFYGVVTRCDLVRFVRNPQGGSPMPIINRIDRGQA